VAAGKWAAKLFAKKGPLKQTAFRENRVIGAKETYPGNLRGKQKTSLLKEKVFSTHRYREIKGKSLFPPTTEKNLGKREALS